MVPLNIFKGENYMKKSILKSVIAFCALLTLALTISAQPKAPASPAATLEATIAGKKVTINYSRPSMKGRKVMGELVPYDKVWRTGANKATVFTTEVDLMFGKTVVPAGTYSLFTLPSASGWKLIINKFMPSWGIPYKAEYEKDELARIPMTVGKTAAPVEMFTINLEGKGKKGKLTLEWENTSAAIEFAYKPQK
jgi:Protein of unknown function (DUF2911)